MNKGVEILIARMESSPDEFLTGNKSGKWLHLMEQYEDHMEPEDRKALMDKYNLLKMQKFTERVMKELLEDQQEKSEEFDQYAQQVRSKLQNMAAQQQMYNAAQARSLTGLGSAGQIYMANAAGSIQPIAQSNKLSSSIQLGSQSLTERTLKKIKALIK